MGKGENVNSFEKTLKLFNHSVTTDYSANSTLIINTFEIVHGYSNNTDIMHGYFNSLPDDKILDWSRLKRIADDILKCTKMKNKYHIE